MFVNDGFHGDPAGLAEVGNGRATQRRQAGQQAFEVLLLNVHLEAHLGFRLKRALQEQRERLDLLTLPLVSPAFVVEFPNFLLLK